MAIAFLVNKDLTVPFEAIARHMRAAGETVVWLSPSTRWTKWLRARGWGEDAILSMPDHMARWSAMPEAQSRSILAAYESDPSVTAPHIVRMCRCLMDRSEAYAFGYLAVVAEEADAFMARHGVEMVLGEGTWGFEMAVWLVAQRRGIGVYNPNHTRLPADRFSLVDAVTGALVAPNAATPADREDGRRYLEAWRARPRPAPGATLPSVDRAWAHEFVHALTNRDDYRGDETIWPISRRIADRARRLSVARVASRWLRSLPPPPQDPYVLFCLQHQPEAAIDVYGGFHSDQRHLIETLARMLPATHRLHIREHKAALGDRSMAWYRDVARLPGVEFVNPFADIWPQMKGSAATVTVSGTVLCEASLLDVPALGLAPIHFAELFAVPPSRMGSPLDWPLHDVLDPSQRERFTPSEDKKLDFLAKLFANSAVGEVAVLRAPEEVRAHPDWMRKETDWLLAMFARLRRPYGGAAEPAQSSYESAL
jgi:hypothetical protein